MKKTKKSGGIAIPFLLTFLISLIIIGGAALIIYDKISSEDSSLSEMKNETASLSDEDSHTVLFVLDLSDSSDTYSDEDDEEYDEYGEDDYSEDEDEYYDEDDEEYDEEYDEDEDEDEEEEEIYPEAYTFLLMRSAPVHKQITFIGIPNNMTAGQEEKTAEEIYLEDGAGAVCTAAGFTLGIDIDRYMVLDSDAFIKLCNIFGGANFVVPGGIEGFPETAGEQYLGPDQMEKLVSYGGFSGEVQRISTASSLITAMVNQASGTRIADNLDNTFDTLVNMTDTNITALDYQDKKYGIKFLFKYTDPSDDETVSTRAKFITPYGSQTKNSFDVDGAFVKELEPYFAQEETSENTGSGSGLQQMIPETEAAKENE